MVLVGTGIGGRFFSVEIVVCGVCGVGVEGVGIAIESGSRSVERVLVQITHYKSLALFFYLSLKLLSFIFLSFYLI